MAEVWGRCGRREVEVEVWGRCAGRVVEVQGGVRHNSYRD